MPIRRAANPLTVQHIWNAIRVLHVQKQVADTKKIIKHIQTINEYDEAHAELCIDQAVQDGMIVSLQKLSRMPSPDVVDSFRVPTQDMPILDGMDWYCFECHLGGDVSPCNTCYRVFHPTCTSSGRRRYDQVRKIVDHAINNNGRNDTSINGRKDQNFYDETICSMCNITKNRMASESIATLGKSDLNQLLKFVLSRIRAWIPDTITRKLSVEEEKPEWMTDQELSWRANYLFFEHKDMSVIKVNLNNEAYDQLDEFLADVLTIQHNVGVFHGTESQEFGATELMVRDCIHDLTELQLCVDCYRHSNQKINSKWFCLPCRIPHKLVWAKQKGYPYWPAKIIQDTGTHCDVRFFGGKYERALLSKNFIKPIETPQSKLQIKVSAAFTKSVEELRFHQRLLQHPEELQQLITTSKNSTKTLNNSSAANDSNDFFNKTPNSTNGRLKRKNSDNQVHPNKKRESIEMDPCRNNSFRDSSLDNIIHISDGEDEDFSYTASYTTHNNFNNGSYDSNSMSSLNENCNNQLENHNEVRHPNETVRNAVENMKMKLSCMTDNNDLIQCAANCMQRELDKVLNDHNDHLKKLFESHNSQISEMKKKQWCFNCEQEAIYHCCWNTAYCSQSCQQQHWQAEHKIVCRRKR